MTTEHKPTSEPPVSSRLRTFEAHRSRANDLLSTHLAYEVLDQLCSCATSGVPCMATKRDEGETWRKVTIANEPQFFMSREIAAHNVVPKLIRGTHWACFRAGEWAEILTEAPAKGRDCYVVRFSDGATDWWVVDDEMAGYEFK